ncbi:DUF3303 domain-containing protein [Pseudomonas sp. LS1212]|uniref:DUF3303 domain-containing protein n=1 Tax=Pseudomonas sp. LS1212 TaxID=2972478 RepID=UPI00215D34E8|nr:DUF3303 domain-containing protein [Pseudomonas sp. LS1212]UVJ46194.1 DUF3303 domain-containing protein [Pseudomonas sp. LS1212]
MLFILSWTIRHDCRNKAMTRFIESGGALPPDGVTMLGRWHAVGRRSGFGVAEANDVTLLQKWVLNWSDMLDMEVYPAMTDEQIAPLMVSALKQG